MFAACITYASQRPSGDQVIPLMPSRFSETFFISFVATFITHRSRLLSSQASHLPSGDGLPRKRRMLPFFVRASSLPTPLAGTRTNSSSPVSSLKAISALPSGAKTASRKRTLSLRDARTNLPVFTGATNSRPRTVSAMRSPSCEMCDALRYLHGSLTQFSRSWSRSLASVIGIIFVWPDAMSRTHRSAATSYAILPSEADGRRTSQPVCLVTCFLSVPSSAMDQRFIVPSRSLTK